MAPQNLVADFRMCALCECRLLFSVQLAILMLTWTLLLPVRQELLHLLSDKVFSVLCLEPLEKGLRDPSPAVVGAKLTILHNQQSAVRRLDHHFARGHQNSEVGHGCLRRKTEPFCQSFLVSGFDRVELSFLRTAASSNQAVTNPIEFNAGKSLLHDRLLAGVQRFRGHVNRSHTDTWIESLQQSVRELLFSGEFHGFLRQMTVAIKFEREDRHRAALHNVWHV